jgi:hypothetical protein
MEDYDFDLDEPVNPIKKIHTTQRNGDSGSDSDVLDEDEGAIK